MNIDLKLDLWEYLAATDKTVVLYGMGNGADKILAACEEKGITVRDCFASDGFVRKKSFHGMEVKAWDDVKRIYGAQNVIVLLSFGTSRPEVLENILRIAKESELYAPDVPAFGDGLFDRAFFEAHRTEMEEAYSLLSDEESKRIYENVIRFKLTGKIPYLLEAESAPQEIMNNLICPTTLHTTADLGAYNGDTVRELLDACEGSIQKIYALEPDARNFKKLASYAGTEARARVLPYPVGAWSEQTTLFFEDSGNRNASFGQNRSHSLDARPQKVKEIAADALDNLLLGEQVDYIKYDVEGSEKEALLGSVQTIRSCVPTLLVSLYHRNEDIFALPLLLHNLFPNYKSYHLRRLRGIPAWDLNLYVK